MESTNIKGTDFNNKYQQLLSEKNFYRLLLDVKTTLRKLVKKNEIKNFFDLLIWCTNVLRENDEIESCLSLFNDAIQEYEKYFNRADLDVCLESLKKTFESLPKESDKSKLKHKLLMFFESKHISDIALQLHGFYQMFASDSLNNKDISEGYRYALKSQDYPTITHFSDVYAREKLKSEEEKNYFIARLTLELILLKNLKLAFKFISKFTDTSNNYQNNHPIINFTYLLVALFSRDQTSTFDNFWAFINIYKPILTKDEAFPKYLNKISSLYYNQTIIQESGMNNLMNMLRGITG